MERISAGVLKGAGFDEWIATSREAYIQCAVKWASDLPKLREYRQTIRKQLLESDLCDAHGLARSMKDAFQQMWDRRCREE